MNLLFRAIQQLFRNLFFIKFTCMSEETTPNIVGRARRSAAASSKRAWAALLPGKKSSLSDIETESVPDKEEKGDIKDAETPKSQTPVETVSQKRARVGGKRSRSNKVLIENAAVPDASSHGSQTKSPVKKPVKSPSRSPSSPKPQASSRIRPSQKMLMSAGSNSALNSDQLRDIEREIDKHLEGERFDDYEEDDEDESTKRFVLDDNDEDFQLKEKKPAKRSAILKPPAMRVTSNSSDQAFERGSGSRGGRGRGRPAGGVMRGRPTGQTRGGGGLRGAGSPGMQVRPAIDQGMSGMPPMRRDVDMPIRAPPRVFIMKPRDPVNRNVSHMPSTVIPPVPVNIAAMDKEIAELTEKYKDKPVPGSTVQEFSNIVNQILLELNRLHQDNRNLIDYNRRCIEALRTSNATQMELKDERIHQLEQSIETLQGNFLQSRKQMQLSTLKYEYAGESENSNTAKVQNGEKLGSPSGGNGEVNKIVQSRSMLERDESEPNNKMSRSGYMAVSKPKVFTGYTNQAGYNDDEYDFEDDEMDNEYESDEQLISSSRQLTL